MKKSEFLELVKEKGGFTSKTEADNAIKAVISAIKEVALKNDKITFIGLGTFKTVTQKGREGINHLTKKHFKTNDRKVLKFKPSPTLLAKMYNIGR